jgi:hypothetical protein
MKKIFSVCYLVENEDGEGDGDEEEEERGEDDELQNPDPSDVGPTGGRGV